MQSASGESSSEMGERERYHNNNNQKDIIEHDTSLKKFEVPLLKSPPPLSIPAYSHRSIKTRPVIVTEDDGVDLDDYFGGGGRSKDTSGGSLDDEVHRGCLSSSSHHRSIIASTIATTPSPSPPPPTFSSVQVPFLSPPPKSTTTQHRQKPICIGENNSSNSIWLERDYKNRFREDEQKIDTHIPLLGYNQQRVYYRTGGVNNTAEGGQPQLNQISSSSGAEGKGVSFGTVQIRTYETILCDNPSCSTGPSIGIGWRYNPRETNTTVDKVEEMIHIVYGGRNPTPAEDLVLDRVERETILVNLGYSYQDLAINVRSNVKAKGQRRQTVDNLPVTWFEERGESITRSVGKVFRRRQSASHLFNEWKESEQQAKDSVAYKRDMTKR